MKNAAIIVLLLGLVFMSSTVSAKEVVYDMYEYRPLIVGSSWTYEVSSLSEDKQEAINKVLKEDVNGGISIKVVQHDSGWLDYLEESKDGLKRYKHLHPDAAEYGIYHPPAIQYPRYLKIGEVYERENILKDYSKQDHMEVDEETEMFTFKLLGVEDVKVAAGKFKRCLKTLSEWNSYSKEGRQNLNKVVLTWDAKGVGTVKMIYFNRIEGQIVGFSEAQLTSFEK